MSKVWHDSTAGLVAIFVFGTFINVLKFAMPLYTLQILDRIPASRSVETLVMLTIIVLIAVISGVALEAVRKRMLTHWAGWIEKVLGPILVAKGFTQQTSGDSVPGIEALDDIRTLRGFIEKAATPLLDVLWVPLFVLVVYLISPLLSIIMLIAMSIRLVIALIQDGLTKDSRHAAGKATNAADHIVTEARRNAEVVGAYGMASDMTKRWHESIGNRVAQRDRTEGIQATMRALSQGLYRILYVSGMGMGIWLVIQGSLTIGGVIAGNIIMRFGYRIVNSAASRWRMFGRARRAYVRINSQISKNDNRKPASLRQSDLDSPLEIENVSYRYPGQATSVFRKLNLRLKPGEILCVMGPSGSGKSTLMRLLIGSTKPRTGHIRLGNIDVSRLPDRTLSGIAGYLPQSVSLFDGSIRENIARMIDGDFDNVIKAAKLVGIHGVIIRLPQGYDTPIKNAFPMLSGGEYKRIALARAFYGTPKIIVLDEPEAALDSASRKIFIRTVKKLKAEGSIIILATQSPSVGRAANHTLILGGDKHQLYSADEERGSALKIVKGKRQIDNE